MSTLTITQAQETDLFALISTDNPQLIDKLLPQLQSQLVTKMPSNHATIIEMLIDSNCINILSTLVSKHKSSLINIKLRNMCNILHVAIEEKKCALIKLIISNFELENYSKDSNGNSELHKWVLNHSKCEKCLKALSTQSIDLSQYLTDDNNNQINALELAASEGNESACQMLIKYFSFDYGHIDKLNETILHKIARGNLIAIVDFSMSKSILHCLNIMNESCLTIALSKGNLHLAEFFIDKGINVSKEDKMIADSMNDIPFSLAKKIRMKKVGAASDKSIRSASSQFNIRQRLFTERDSFNQLIQKCNNNNNGIEINKGIEVTDFIEHCQSPELKLKNQLSDNNIAVSKLELGTNSKTNKAINNNSTNNDKASIRSCINKSVGGSNAQPQVCFALQENNNNNPSTKSTITAAMTTTAKLSSRLSANMKKKPFHQTFTNLTCSIRSFKRNKSTEDKPLKKNNSYHCNSSKHKVHYASYLSFDNIPTFYTLEYNDIIVNKNSILHCSDNCIIYKGKYLSIEVAIKAYRLDKLLPNELKLLNNEIMLHINLRHPHIVSFIGICIKDNLFFLVTEYSEHNSLKSVLENNKITLTQKTKFRIILEIARGIYYLHKRNPIVYHRDLKSSNVLIDKHFTAKLCDFGISKTIEHPTQAMQTNSQSTPYWMAPEYILEGRFTDKSDIYSFGILVWEIIIRDTLPYKNNNIFDFILGNREALKQRPIIPDDLANTDFNDSMKELTIQCWSSNPNQRPSIALIVSKLEKIIESINNDNT